MASDQGKKDKALKYQKTTENNKFIDQFYMTSEYIYPDYVYTLQHTEIIYTMIKTQNIITIDND